MDEDEYGVGNEIVNLNDDDAKDKLNKPLDYSTDSAHSNQVRFYDWLVIISF